VKDLSMIHLCRCGNHREREREGRLKTMLFSALLPVPKHSDHSAIVPPLGRDKQCIGRRYLSTSSLCVALPKFRTKATTLQRRQCLTERDTRKTV